MSERQLILEHSAEVCQWVGSQMSFPCEFRDSFAIGVARDGEIIAGVVYSPFRAGDMEMSVAAKPKSNWLGRELLGGFFWYPFEKANCRRVTALIPAHNIVSRKFCERIGFTLEGYHERGFANDDAISYGLLRENCKWIEQDVGWRQGRTRSAAGS